MKLLVFSIAAAWAPIRRRRSGIATHTVPDTALVRHYASRAGLALNIEQQIDDNLGLFLRASLNDGSKEAYEFTEINRSLAIGASLKGTDWGRPNDTVGLAAVTNRLSHAGQRYFAAGGTRNSDRRRQPCTL